MGIYSSLLFTSTFVFILLVFSVDSSCVHAWVFGIQMLWQTFWHLLIQYREYYLQEPVSIRLFLAVSSLMLLTQRMTSVSMDLQEKRVLQAFKALSMRKTCVMLLPFISYILNFTTMLGGPLCSYSRFVSLMAGISFNHSPNPLGVVFLKLMQVLLLEWVRYCLVYFLKHNTYDPSNSIHLYGIMWVWGLAAVLRIQYYSHWKISESLNNAAGFGYWDIGPGDSPDWSRLSDGDFWTIEALGRMSEFARQWNATSALWLRRLVYRSVVAWLPFRSLCGIFYLGSNSESRLSYTQALVPKTYIHKEENIHLFKLDKHSNDCCLYRYSSRIKKYVWFKTFVYNIHSVHITPEKYRGRHMDQSQKPLTADQPSSAPQLKVRPKQKEQKEQREHETSFRVT
ncbi:hypothetical protein FQN60_018052, partial [Etheostoma spectabile]